MTTYQCLYCEISLFSDEERKKHEEVCIKNGKTNQERFKAKKRTEEQKKNK